MQTPIRTPRLRKTCPSADSFVMHPMIAEVDHASWTSPTAVEHGDEYAIMVTRLERIPYERLDLVSKAMHMWTILNDVDVCVTRRALIDVPRRRLWCVDFMCGIQGRCWLVCMFIREDGRLLQADVEFAHRIRWLAHTQYRSDVGVAAVSISACNSVKTLWIPPANLHAPKFGDFDVETDA